MPSTNSSPVIEAAPNLPAYATIKSWTGLTGISRSKTYELLNAGKLKAVRVGGRTLIDVVAGLEWLGQQPHWTGRVD